MDRDSQPVDTATGAGAGAGTGAEAGSGARDGQTQMLQARQEENKASISAPNVQALSVT